MLTIKDYISKHPVWFDGTKTTYKKIRIAVKTGRLKAHKNNNTFYIEEDGEGRAKGQDEGKAIDTYKLKETYTAIKIKREEAKLYENKLVFAEKIAEVLINEFHNPRVAALAEIVQKNGSEELFKLWNQEVISGFQERLNRLQEELYLVIQN